VSRDPAGGDGELTAPLADRDSEVTLENGFHGVVDLLDRVRSPIRDPVRPARGGLARFGEQQRLTGRGGTIERSRSPPSPVRLRPPARRSP
jgi:hypothetical protein